MTEIGTRLSDPVAEAFAAGVAAERARCIKIAEAQSDESNAADNPYDGGSGSLGYESACRDIAEAIAKTGEQQKQLSAKDIMALHDRTMAALKAAP